MTALVFEGAVDLAAEDSEVQWDFHGILEDFVDDGNRSSSPVRRVGEAPLDNVDGGGGGLQPGLEEAETVSARLLERVHCRLQNPPAGPFDREDLRWTKQINSGRGGLGKGIYSAIIPWDRLEDFVEGEESVCDFPCILNRKKRPDVKPGSRVQPRAGTYTQLIRYSADIPCFPRLCSISPLFCTTTFHIPAIL
jgi:hypothetical protein